MSKARSPRASCSITIGITVIDFSARGLSRPPATPGGRCRRGCATSESRSSVGALSREGAPTRRPSRVGDVGDAGAGLGEGFEPVGFDASPELRERSSDQAEMERTDDGRAGRRSLLEGAVFEHDLLSARRSPKFGAEAVLLVETDDLVDRLLLRDRRKRWWPVDEVGAPCPSGLLGASAGVAL